MPSAWQPIAALALCLAALAPNRAAAQEPVRIGFSMALSGPLAGFGRQALLGMKIWEEETNARGGLLGRPVKLVYYDDQSNPSTVPGIYTKLIDVDRVDGRADGRADGMGLLPSTSPPHPARILAAGRARRHGRPTSTLGKGGGCSLGGLRPVRRVIQAPAASHLTAANTAPLSLTRTP